MSIEQKRFGELPDGRQVDLFILKNSRGASVEVIPFGCRIVRLWMPDRQGTMGDVVLGHDTLSDYLRPGDYLGAAVGRYANRIGGAAFNVNGKTCTLPKNDGGNCLHGGPQGWSHQLFRVKCSNNDDDAPSITLTYRDLDGTSGFPGNVEVDIQYTLTTDNAVIIDYKLTPDADTPVNPTNHSFFNLTGDHAESVLHHELLLEADAYTAVGDGLIPNGELIPVAGGPFDFTKAKTIGQDIRADDAVLQRCGGYDHNFALRGTGMRKAAEACDQRSGRAMLVFTDLPGVQLYSSNDFADGERGKNNVAHKKHCAFCLETQFYPDTPNRPSFPSCIAKAGEVFTTGTIYKFEVR